MRIRPSAPLLAALALAAATPAMAKDLCIKAGTTTLIVVRGWNPPGANKCKAVIGSGPVGGAAHGTVCRNADGNVLRWGVSLQTQGGIFSSSTSKQFVMGMSYPDYATSGTIFTETLDSSLVLSDTFSGQSEICTGPPLS
jgi:hypothetical protein